MKRFERGQESINAVIEAWNKLNVGPLDTAKLEEVVRGHNLPTIVKNSLMQTFKEADLMMAGRPITREKMAEITAPLDLIELQQAIKVAENTSFGVFTVGGINSKGVFAIDPTKVADFKKRNQVLTEDSETLSAVHQIIESLKILYANGKLDPDRVNHWLVSAKILDNFFSDGMQPNRGLFVSH